MDDYNTDVTGTWKSYFLDNLVQKMRFKNQGNPTCIALILMITPNLRLYKMVVFNFHMLVVAYSLTECGFCVPPEIKALLLNFLFNWIA